MNVDAFLRRRGVRYYSQFKPSESYELHTGLLILPAGWAMIPTDGGTTRQSISYIIGPDEWSEKQLWSQFREWLVFDSFVMHSDAVYYFDKNMLTIEECRYRVEQGRPGDADDQYKATDYSDITRFLVGQFTKSDDLASLTYRELFSMYCALPDHEKDIMEWYVSCPPSSSRVDAFFGPYWQILHIVVLLETLIKSPPACTVPTCECVTCGMTPPKHSSMSRGDWLRAELARRVQDGLLVEEFATTIEAARKIRNKISHVPHFDRSTHPQMNYHGETLTYDIERAISEFQEDSIALFSLLISLRRLAHSLIVDQAFGIKHYERARPLHSTYLTGSAQIC